MCIAPKVNIPEQQPLPKPPPPLAPPEKTADELIVNPNATNEGRAARRRRPGATPDLDALRIPLNLPRAGSAEGTNLP